MNDKEKLECIRSLRHIAEIVKSSGIGECNKHFLSELMLRLLDEIVRL